MTNLAERESGFEQSMPRAPGAGPQGAIANGGLVLCAQEIAALHPATRPVRMQALLVRTRGESGNPVRADGLLPAHGQAGTMSGVDWIVVQRALAACATADPAPREGLPVFCVKLSVETLRDPSFADRVDDALERLGISGENLCFEIEETDTYPGGAQGACGVRALKQLGCRICLDGFGATGVALEGVRVLALDFIKIDGRIVGQIQTDPIALEIIQVIRRSGEAIGVRSIAQMVDDPITLRMLRSAGVHYAQGAAIAAARPFSPPV